MIKQLQDKMPVIGKGSFVAETAAVIGDVVMGENCSIWYSAVLRGDVNRIRLGNRVNVQDCSCIHTSLGDYDVIVADDVTIGHNVCLHGAHIGSHCLIGMGATVLDGVKMADNSIIAAGALVLQNTVIGPYELWGGVPAKLIKKISQEAIDRIVNNGLEHYAYWTEVYCNESAD